MRNLGLIITFCLASFALPTNSFALGLGEIEINSFLNQPLNAEIKVISARAGEIDDLLVTLASRDSFKRAGLSRPRHLSELRFAVKKNEEADSAVILVTTKTAVKEPFLNFLVEADWAKGRVLREFTVLLDPPFYADSPAPAEVVSQPTALESTTSSTAVPTPIVEESSTGEMVTPIPITPITELSEEQNIIEPIEFIADEPVEMVADEPVMLGADEPDKLSADEIIALSTEELVALYGNKPIALSEETQSSIDSEEDSSIQIVEEQTIFADESELVMVGDLRIEKGDTLWSLASQFMDSEHSIDQVMLAIQSMNPAAFNNNNINNLQIGAVLRAPDDEQLDRLNEREAHVDVLRQNGLWDDYVARVTGSAPVSMAGGGSESGAGGEGGKDLTDLSLLAPGDGDSDAAGLKGEGKDANELSRQLALAEEELEASQVENTDLESRIAELEATLSKVQELQKMVEIEDDSLAQLQADQATEAADRAAAEAVEAAEAAAAQQAAEEQAVIQQALEAAKQTEQDSKTANEEEALLDKLLAEDSTTEGQTGVTPPAPVIVTEPAPGLDSVLDSIVAMLDGIIPPDILDTLGGVLDVLPSIDSILADPVMLGALGGVVVLLLILVIYKRRKSSDSDDDSDDDGITLSVGDDDLFGSEDELTPIHLASQISVDETSINVPDAKDLKDEEPDLAPMAVVSQVEVVETEAQTPNAEEQDDTLNEVDVYLAYGLYDNAEDLLNQSLEANPDRADYRAKLLDTYFATKNAEKFSEQAGTLKSMGSAADSYWDRVQVMGYELAPDNALFSGGKDSDISVADFGLSKPEAADFDLGSEEDSTNFSTTDFNLGEESGDFSDNQNFVETVAREESAPEEIGNTQELPNFDELPELEESDSTNIGEAPAEDLEELEFAFDVEDESAKESDTDDAMDFDLPGDMDLGADEVAEELPRDNVEATALIDMVDDFDATAFDLDTGDDSDAADNIDLGADEVAEELPRDNEATALIDMVDDSDATAFDLDTGDDSDAADNIDLGMDDTSLDELELGDLETELGFPDDDDENYEPTAFTSAIDEEVTNIADDFSLDLGDDDAAMDVDLDSEPAKTDTFLPGDFDDPEELTASESDIEDVDIDDLDDFMLPDDVDEVGTKLDLARAFVDMGDTEGARSSLEEVMSEGDEKQKKEATIILEHL